MKFSLSTLTPFLPLLAVAAPAPAPAPAPANSDLTTRQGGVFYAVSDLFSGGGCTQPIYPYAVFGAADVCQQLPTDISVVSFNTTAIYQDLAPSLGCHGPLMLSFFTDEHCTTGRTTSQIDNCEQASNPFRSLELECVM